MEVLHVYNQKTLMCGYNLHLLLLLNQHPICYREYDILE